MPSSSRVVFRRSGAEDCEAVYRLLATSVRHLAPIPYSQDVIDTWMTGIEADDYHDICAEQSVWIATIDDMPIGFAQGIPGEIKYLFVDADHAGKGVGAELMERALHDARSDGVDTVKIIATLNAVPFYMKWGFQKIKQTVLPDRDDSLPPIDIVEMERAVFSR